MSIEVKLRAVDGALKDEEFVFDEKGLCLVGRSGDCALHIPKEKDMRISRRHCLLILDPPKARIRDLGSRNGTFVNGTQLDPGTIGDVPEQMAPQDLVINNGDKLTIGETEFEVIIPSQEAAVRGPVPPPPGTKIIKLAKPSNAQLGAQSRTQPGSVIPKSTPVDTGFFIAPGKGPGRSPNTATAPMTEAFSRPKVSQPVVVSSEPGTDNQAPKKVIAKKVTPAAALKPAQPAPDATLILRAKPPAPPPETPPAAPVQATAEEPQPVVEEKPKKVLKAKIVKRKPQTSAEVPAPPPVATPVSDPVAAPPPTPVEPPAVAVEPEQPVQHLPDLPVPPANGTPEGLVDPRKEYNPELTEVMDVSELADDIKLSADYIKKEKKNKRVTKFKVKGPK